ncbi:helix-turn-helix domain-containing protein [Teredinibacter purpureus]|uniref:helix-turn-helix domain-containing protein n=1 Tax=Teredinibacter purpureus TaxID=2731756 RepID=UPI000698DBCD|nr:helix-turn-helix domain-containing protein [Teredinibacter purpureus]
MDDDLEDKRRVGEGIVRYSTALPLSGNLGERLQAVRKQQGLSQRELARRADVTNSTLSMIEQGKVSPSVSSLEKILSAIPLTMQEFFSDNLELMPPIYREGDFVKVQKDGAESCIMPLTEAGRDGVYISRQTYSPGANIASEWMMRKGFVGGIVVNGILTLRLDGHEYHLDVGEGFHFSLHRSHSLANHGQKECTVISVSFSDRRT